MPTLTEIKLLMQQVTILHGTSEHNRNTKGQTKNIFKKIKFSNALFKNSALHRLPL